MDLPLRLFAALEHQLPRLLWFAGWRSRRVVTETGRLQVFDIAGTGTGPPFLLIHGLGARAADYALLVARLKPLTRRILVPDLPGHGWSTDEAPDPRRLDALVSLAATRLLDEPAYVLGNSMGGLVAVRLALAHPDRVRALLLLSPAGAPLDEGSLSRLQRLFRVGTHAEALVFVDRLLGPAHRLRTLIALGVRARFARPAVRHILAHLSNEQLLTPAEVGALTMPVWFCWGGRDRVLGARFRDFYLDALPAGTVVDTPARLSHSPFLEAPGGVARRVRDFVARVAAGGHNTTIMGRDPLPEHRQGPEPT